MAETKQELTVIAQYVRTGLEKNPQVMHLVLQAMQTGYTMGLVAAEQKAG